MRGVSRRRLSRQRTARPWLKWQQPILIPWLPWQQFSRLGRLGRVDHTAAAAARATESTLQADESVDSGQKSQSVASQTHFACLQSPPRIPTPWTLWPLRFAIAARNSADEGTRSWRRWAISPAVASPSIRSWRRWASRSRKQRPFNLKLSRLHNRLHRLPRRRGRNGRRLRSRLHNRLGHGRLRLRLHSRLRPSKWSTFSLLRHFELATCCVAWFSVGALVQLARSMLYAVSEIHVWFLQMLQERNLNTK
jgi:hypothetical protein